MGRTREGPDEFRRGLNAEVQRRQNADFVEIVARRSVQELTELMAQTRLAELMGAAGKAVVAIRAVSSLQPWLSLITI
jgi:hypothetical protein